jgi:hypothetical protein
MLGAPALNPVCWCCSLGRACIDRKALVPAGAAAAAALHRWLILYQSCRGFYGCVQEAAAPVRAAAAAALQPVQAVPAWCAHADKVCIVAAADCVVVPATLGPDVGVLSHSTPALWVAWCLAALRSYVCSICMCTCCICKE